MRSAPVNNGQIAHAAPMGAKFQALPSLHSITTLSEHLLPGSLEQVIDREWCMLWSDALASRLVF